MVKIAPARAPTIAPIERKMASQITQSRMKMKKQRITMVNLQQQDRLLRLIPQAKASDWTNWPATAKPDKKPQRTGPAV